MRFLMIICILAALSKVFVSYGGEIKLCVHSCKEYSVPASIQEFISGEKEIDDKVVVFRRIDNNATFPVKIRKGVKFSLPFGTYTAKCNGFGLSIGVFLGEQVITHYNGENVKLFNYGNPRLSEHDIYIYFYPESSLVTVRGRVLTSDGYGVSDMLIRGTPLIIDFYDWNYYEGLECKTDKNGYFELKRLPPASPDVALVFLKSGHLPTKARETSEQIFNCQISVIDVIATSINCLEHLAIPLLSARNTMDIMKSPICNGMDMKRIETKLPVSTNDVIYVPDIILSPRTNVKTGATNQ